MSDASNSDISLVAFQYVKLSTGSKTALPKMFRIAKTGHLYIQNQSQWLSDVKYSSAVRNVASSVKSVHCHPPTRRPTDIVCVSVSASDTPALYSTVLLYNGAISHSSGRQKRSIVDLGLYLLSIVYESSPFISRYELCTEGPGRTPISGAPPYRAANGNKWLHCWMCGTYGVTWNETNWYAKFGNCVKNFTEIFTDAHLILVWIKDIKI